MLALLAAPAAADFRDGLIAVQREDYETARQEFMAMHQAGDARGTFMLGVMAERAWGLPPAPDRDLYPYIDQAIEWYGRAADAGVSSAHFNLGIIHLEGRGVERDYTAAFASFSAAADLGHGGAMNNLGSMYENGIGVRRDIVEAMKWYVLAGEYMRGEDVKISHSNTLRLQESLSAKEIAEAKARTDAWRAAHP